MATSSSIWVFELPFKKPLRQASMDADTPVYAAFGYIVGGVISPLLANLFLHYAFDSWMERTDPSISFERYEDDIICHCESLEQTKLLKTALEARLC